MTLKNRGKQISKRLLVLALIGLAAAWHLAGCSTLVTPAPAPAPAEAEPAGDILAVQREHEDQLMAIPGVTGVGVGECEGEPCLKVLVTARTPELEQAIPSALDGFRVEIEETGDIQAQEGGE
jgi:hypothetical protein